MTPDPTQIERAERPAEKPTAWKIGVCEGCDVQHGPHVKGCPHARKKWFPVKLIEVVAR